MASTTRDGWLLPRQQTEIPAKDLVSETELHGRRESTFLALATLALVATAALVLVGVTRVIDPESLVMQLVPVDVLVAFGAVPLALGLVALALTHELFGRRRTTALLVAQGAACAALLGLVAPSDRIMALATAALCIAAYVAHVLVFAGLRRRFEGVAMRTLVSVALAQIAGWGAFGIVMYAASPDAIAAMRPIALGSAAFVVGCTIVLLPLVAIVSHALGVYLRVANSEPVDHEALPVRRRLPQALIVDDDIRPYNSAEMRFFADGDRVEAAPDGN